MEAFRNALARWPIDMVELDVRATADGACVLMHDPTVDRTTDGSGPVERFTLEELRRLDAGYYFTPDGGRTFPFRGHGVRVPTFDEVLEAFPDLRIIVELKTGAAQLPLKRALDRMRAHDRVILAGARESFRTIFDDYPGVRSASYERLRVFVAVHRLRCGRFARPRFEVAQVPETQGRFRIVTPALIRDLHRHGIPVHVWTVNRTEDMRRLLEWGVDGILTDFPDRLMEVLGRRPRGEP